MLLVSCFWFVVVVVVVAVVIVAVAAVVVGASLVVLYFVHDRAEVEKQRVHIGCLRNG